MQNQKSAVQRNHAPAKESGEFLIGDDLRVTRLGFGAMRITGDGVWGEPKDRAEAVRVLRRAVELGINFIDTADSYGPGVSEEIIAEALHPYPTGLVIATKGGFDRPGPNQWVENGKPEHLRSACEGSLRRLRMDRIDLYQLHRIDPKVPAEDQLGTLRDLQAQGKIKHIGLSEVTVRQIQHARTIIARNDSPDIPFTQSINPYQGCEHGCIYCYARPSHAYLELSPGLDFETKLFAKTNAAEQLRAELAKPGYKPSPIALGANTDC